jgi:CBS-domain-containing membrane protein
MFAVYGIEGSLFRGSLEDLRRVESVRAVARTRAIPSSRSGAHQHDFTGIFQPVHPAAGTVVHHNMLAAYGEAEQPHLPRHPLTRVGDIMSHRVTTVAMDSPVLDAWQLLATEGVGQAPVVSASGALVGLLSRADLLRPDRLPAPGASSLIWRSEIMWTPIPCVAQEADIRQLASVLLDNGLPGLPVVDDHGVVTGFVSRSDILRAVVTDPPLDLWG